MGGLNWLIVLCSVLLALSEKTRLLAFILICVFCAGFVFRKTDHKAGVRVKEVRS